MRSLVLIVWIFLTCLAIGAEEAVVHEFSPGKIYRPPGYPASSYHVMGIAGKPLRIVCLSSALKGAPQASSVRVDRITASSRIAVLNDKAAATAVGWSWEWTPPLTRGIVTYEIRFQERSDTTILLEIRDAVWLKDQLAMVALLKWEASGITPQEMSALTTRLGIRRIEPVSHDGRSEPFLRMTANDAGQSRRQVTWDQRHHDLVVWRNGTAAQDLNIRAPRWWISTEALATDQGIIRFLDLFTEPPIAP